MAVVVVVVVVVVPVVWGCGWLWLVALTLLVLWLHPLLFFQSTLREDPSIALDYVLHTKLDSGAFDLLSCVTLFPLMSELLATHQTMDEHVLGLITAVQTLYRGFGALICQNAVSVIVFNVYMVSTPCISEMYFVSFSPVHFVDVFYCSHTVLAEEIFGQEGGWPKQPRQAQSLCTGE